MATASESGLGAASAVALGAAGLIPFAALAAAVIAGFPTLLGVPTRPALALYGAVILSFLGGIRWGIAATRGLGAFDYALAVVPSLLAWASLGLPAPWDLRGLGAVVLLWGMVDQDLPRRGLAPIWLGRLRLALSGVAGLCLLAAGG